MHVGDSVITLAGFVFDPGLPELREHSGAPVPLRPQTLCVLQHLARQANNVVTKDELMRAIWPDVVVTDDSLVQCITEIRRALHDEAHRIVRTEPRRGYRLVATSAAASEAAVGDDAFAQDIRFASTVDGVRIA